MPADSGNQTNMKGWDNAFLWHMSEKHREEFVVMVLGGAPSHRSQGLEILKNVCLVRLPSYSPELNPAERLWEELGEEEFGNCVFDSLGAAIAQAARAPKRLGTNLQALHSLTGWNWIMESS